MLEACVCDDGVESAEALHCGFDGFTVSLSPRQICLERLARPVAVGMQIHGENAVSVAFQAFRDRAADAAGRTVTSTRRPIRRR